MTTDDNRSRAAGGYSDSGLFDRGGDSDYARSDADFDDAGYSSAQTTVLPGATSPFDSDFDSVLAEEPSKPPIAWHGGLDFGLLVLRLVLGGLFVAHGLDKLFGWFDGLGRGGTEQLLTGFGFTEPAILTWVLAISETTGGALLILGLFTPIGAAAVLGVMANVIVVKADWSLFLGGVELEMMYAGAAFALLFTGPGRVALDRNTHWFGKAPAYGFVFLIIAAGAAAVTLFVFR
ncbi:DoxX family protein [Actinophytocola sp.]|uniref:DoxX family protein n=1 Tax=Actinophytocola sp. TaxID=1872138 RepID=UPI003D6AE86B